MLNTFLIPCPCPLEASLSMTKPGTSQLQTVLDLFLQLTEQSLNIIQRTRPLIQQLRTNEQLQQFLKMANEIYTKLPESVSLALTVAVIFISSLMVFRIGKSLISALVTAIQVAIVLLVAFVVWKLRDPLSLWLEQILNQ